MDLQLNSERDEAGVVTLWLDSPHRSVVVLDGWLLDQLHLFFDRLEAEEEPTGFVLASASDRVFVAGADLAEIDALPDDQLHAYLTEGAEAFARISALPCPSVAVVSGAVLGGGLEIAMHCDGLVAAKPAQGAKSYRVGLPEAGLGLCPGWGGTQMLPARVDPAEAIAFAATGVPPVISDFPAGLFDEIVDDAAKLPEAARRWLKAHPRTESHSTPRCIDGSNRAKVGAGLEAVRDSLPDSPAAHAVIEAVEIGLVDGFSAGIAAERRLLVSLRHTKIARSKLQAFFGKNKKS